MCVNIARPLLRFSASDGARGARHHSALPLWHTPFSMDVAFASDGKAFIYDTHLAPTWKRPGHWRHPNP